MAKRTRKHHRTVKGPRRAQPEERAYERIVDTTPGSGGFDTPPAPDGKVGVTFGGAEPSEPDKTEMESEPGESGLEDEEER